MGEPLVKAKLTPGLGVSVIFLPRPGGGGDPAPLKHVLSPVFIDPESQRELWTDEVPGVHSPREKGPWGPLTIHLNFTLARF